MDGLHGLLPAHEIITQESHPARYNDLTTFWAAQVNLSPGAVLAPSQKTLAKVVEYLYHHTELDFGFRGQGYTSLPTKDVLISLESFDNFAYNCEKNTITVGAGQPWTNVYQQIEEHAPNYTVVGARTPSVGVGGTIVTGGFSWLSGHLGCISDPQNMLDCEVVKFDGTRIWASSEPDLLWAIRGGGGGFGAIINVVFQLHPVSRSVYFGTITTPKSSLAEAMSRISKFSTSGPDAGVSVFMFLERLRFQNMHDHDHEANQEELLVFQVFDSNGGAHGRRAFEWILSLPGAQDFTREGTMLQAIKTQDRVASLSGKSRQYWAPIILSSFTERQLERCVAWFDALEKHGKSIAENTYMVYELFCTKEASSPLSMAWPGPRGRNHMLIIGVGCAIDASQSEIDTARELARTAPADLSIEGEDVISAPNAVEEWSDMAQVYGEHYEKLLKMRKIYDPLRRFKAHLQ